MKIAILADSLALPRQKEEGDTPYEATYPFLLDQNLRRRWGGDEAWVIERGMRRRTIQNVIEDWFEMVELRKPHVVVVHVGIVDCAPRVFLRKERDLVERLRPARLRIRILDFAHEHRRSIVSLRKKVYVPAEQFAKGVERVVELARDCAVESLVFVNIITPPEEMEERSPGFLRNVEIYNDILRERTNQPGIKLIELNELITNNGGSKRLTIDGIHLSNEGHRLLAHELEAHIETLATAHTAMSGAAEKSL